MNRSHCDEFSLFAHSEFGVISHRKPRNDLDDEFEFLEVGFMHIVDQDSALHEALEKLRRHDAREDPLHVRRHLEQPRCDQRRQMQIL